MRVSTAKQGRSGLGLEAQLSAIQAYSNARGGAIVGAFTEVESGKVNSRPELARAIHLAKVTGATLVIAKLDRLSRNASFLLALRDSGVRFVAADMPDANELTVGIMALVAQQEREAISRRTKEALAAARARGQRLGNPRGAEAIRRAGKGNDAAVAAVVAGADLHARRLAPVIAELNGTGLNSLGALAEALNSRGMLTPREKRWHKSSVRNLLSRLAVLGCVE
ncbi:recombinase family protein [Arenimonas sp.]|uniref:recombinase family protein n=1 Tax=Arenimonas sp. TaxID=1872635 RepID=UPI002E35F029|nr:recombinase family protein [Arenimonas sp.]HEX4853054.1 recombinase family protein [Arenimonas sp.]